MNKAFLIGRVGRNPEIRHSQSGIPVATFSLATSDFRKNDAGERIQETEWHKIVAWAGLAKICDQYVTKGSLISIIGKIKTRKWHDTGGVEKFTTEIIAVEIELLAGGRTVGGGGSGDDVPF